MQVQFTVQVIYNSDMHAAPPPPSLVLYAYTLRNINIRLKYLVRVGGRGRSGRKKVGRELSRTGELFSGVQVEKRIHFSTPNAGFSGQKNVKGTQKYVVLGVFG